MTFRELPAFVRTIHHDIPGLVHLAIAVKGLESAEECSQSKMEEDCLSELGEIYTVMIYTPSEPEHRTPLFNTLRVLAPVLGPQSELTIGFSHSHRYGKHNTNAYQYLRR